MNNYVLYGYGESVASNMARVALSEKEISYKYNVVYLESKGEHLRENYRKLNPKTLLPTLTIDGKPLPDSIEIMKYIDLQGKIQLLHSVNYRESFFELYYLHHS